MTAIALGRGIQMLGFFVGAVCGIVELFLLMSVTKAAQAGESARMLLLLLLKLIVLGCAFAIVILFIRSQLLWCAIGVSVSLVGGAVIVFIKRSNSKGDRES